MPCCARMGTWPGARFTLVWVASGVGNARNVAFVPERAGQGAVEGSRLVP